MAHVNRCPQICAAAGAIALLGVFWLLPQASAKTTTLTFCSFSDGVATKIKQTIIEAFEKQYPDIKVKYNNMSGQPYTEKIFTMLSAGAPVDVMWCGEETPYWGQAGLLRNLSPYMAKDKDFDPDDFFPSVMKAFKWKGSFYAFPKDFSTTVFYVNNKLFSQNGAMPPKDGWTWDDMIALGKKLTKDVNGDRRIDQWGLALEFWDRFMYSYIWQAGGDVFNDENTQCLLGTKESVKAIQFIGDLVNSYKVAPLQIDYANNFQQDKIAMYQCGRWFVANLRAGRKTLDWDVAPLPKDKYRSTYMFLGGYGIAKSSKHPDEAWKFVKFLTGKKAQQIRSSMGQSVPSRKSVAGSESFLEPGLRPKNAEAFLEQVEFARSRPGTGRYEKALAIFWPSIWDVLSGKKSAAEAMPKAAADTTRFLQRK